MPPKVEACAPGPKALGHRLAREHRAHGQAVGQCLGEGHDVGRDTELLVGEERARAAHAGLDLVKDQQQAGLVADRTHLFEKIRVRTAHTALSLDRLKQDRRRGRADLGANSAGIVEGHEIKAVQQRIESVLDLFLAGGGQGGHGPAVEGLFHADDPVALPLAPVLEMLARQLDGRLVGFGAAVAEKDPVGEAMGDQPLGQLQLRHGIEEVGYVPEGLGLLGQGRGDLRMRMPQIADGDAGQKIGIALAGVVPEGAAAAPGQHDRKAFVGLGNDLVYPCHGGAVHSDHSVM